MRAGIVYDVRKQTASNKTAQLEPVEAHHSFGTHSAPWHLAEVAELAARCAAVGCMQAEASFCSLQALRRSGCVTDDIEAAQAVYV